MTPIRRILVPVDFSACSMAALEHAAVWSRKFDAAIDLLHVWQVPVYALPGAVMAPSPEDGRLIEVVREASEKQMQAFVSAARARGIEVRSARCILGIPSAQIVDASREYDLIVMGTHGRTGLKHVLLGSVAERVVRLAECPVVTVRRPSADATS